MSCVTFPLASLKTNLMAGRSLQCSFKRVFRADGRNMYRGLSSNLVRLSLNRKASTVEKASESPTCLYDERVLRL